ncbi:MAG: formylglycine-generating enzyme family protein [Verrucomicrobia bacterium]|nr:formylglycine-generating enzyme family protein [Verrucomicrobiota bacterium]
MTVNKLTSGLLGLALVTVMAQAAKPTINCKTDGDDLIVSYTGTLYQSEDAVHWTEVASASSPYQVKMGNKKLFFCSKGESENKNFTIPLSDTVDLDMIWIEPGTFIMGSPEDELGRGVYYSETQHQVTLTQGYWMGKFEVTRAQYEAVMGTNPSGSGRADLPVARVNWSESMEFCAKLTAIEREAGRLPEGYEYTLPTEAQWEYACRAGTTTALNSGKNLSEEDKCPEMDEVGWYGNNSRYSNGNMDTHPVGQKLPNAWGLYDMHGNVWEWCLDWYGTYPVAAVIDPMGADTGFYHVNRGGSIAREAYICRSAARNGPSDGRYIDAGFRVALAPIYVSKNITIPLSEDVNLRMIWIEPGTFMMGSPEDELGRKDNETQHQVTLTQGYWLGKYEITQAQYEAVMGTNPSYYKGANLPVECVSWYDAKEFCSKLTDLEMEAGRLPEGYRYTLPTEAQWEYACRAGTTTALNSGKNLSDEEQCSEMDEVGWYWYNAGIKSYEKGLICTRAVGQKMPNAWGLYDMHGNVAEWCADFYEDYPTSAVVDPTGPDAGIERVARWGSWWNYAWGCRSAYRGSDAPDAKYTNLGFRVALAPVQYP